MDAFRCHLPRTEFGAGRLNALGGLARRYGTRAFLAVDPYLDEIGLGERVAQILTRSAIEVVKYTKIHPNPSCFSTDEGAIVARDSGSEFVVAVGGGGTIDFGKGVAVLSANPGTCWRYTNRSDHKMLRPEKVLPIVAIPTTAGAGSEATHYATFYNPEVHEGSAITNVEILPELALVDPELTHSMPPELTAVTGFDALGHAIEATISLRANPFSRLLALEAIRLVAAHLPVAVADGSDAAARANMAWAALLAGAAFASAGLTLPQAMAQAVSGLTGAPHGSCLAACMVNILDFTYLAVPQIFADVAAALDPSVEELQLDERAARCSELVASFLTTIDLGVRFSDLGLTAGDVDNVTRIAVTTYRADVGNHPMLVDEEDIRRIYNECL